MQLLPVFSRRGRVRSVKNASLPHPSPAFGRSFAALYQVSEPSCNRESPAENTRVLLIWEVSITSFYNSSPADLLVLFLPCCPFYAPLLLSLFSLITPFLSSLLSFCCSFSWAGRKWLPCLWILWGQNDGTPFPVTLFLSHLILLTFF